MKQLLLNLAYWFIQKYDTAEQVEDTRQKELETQISKQERILNEFIIEHKAEMLRILNKIENIEDKHEKQVESHDERSSEFNAHITRIKELMERMDKISWSMPSASFIPDREPELEASTEPNVTTVTYGKVII